MSHRWIDRPLLAQSSARIVRRADCEQLMAAQDIVASARASAAALRSELDTLRQDAMRAGHAAGLAQGQAAWAQQLAARHLSRQAQLCDLQPALLDLVMGTVRHLLQQLPDECRFELLARQVISSTIRARRLRLVVAHADAASAQEVLEAWRLAHAEVASIDVVVDTGLRPGDCVLETEEGAIDGRLEQRLTDIESALAGHLAAVSAGVSAATSIQHGAASP